MAVHVSVGDRRLSGQLQQALQSLRRAGCDKTNTLYILSAHQLVASGLSLHLLKVLAATTAGVAAAVAVGGEPPAPVRLVMRLLDDMPAATLRSKWTSTSWRERRRHGRA